MQRTYNVLPIVLNPSLNNPTMIMGILKANINVPVSIPTTLLIMTANPEIPPGAILFGSKNKAIDAA